MSRKTKNETETLRQYVERRGPFATPEAAVSVLMPVANELKRLHETGAAHLELSPDSVVIENGGLRLKEPSGHEPERQSPGFAAPEMYGGPDSGAVSDVYSFCALLRYAVDGKAPEDAFARAKDPGEMPSAYAYAEAYSVTSLRRITEKGMRPDPDRRYGSMQELIYDLMPFNRMQGWRLPTGRDKKRAAVRARRRRVRRPILAALICLVAAAIIAAGAIYGGYIRSLALAMKGKYSEAWKLIPLQQTIRLVDRNYPDYVRAGMLMEKGEYSEAAELFAGLGDYRRAGELALESRYRYAASLADADEYDAAEEVYAELAESDYRDSASLARDVRYQKALHALYEEKAFEKAYAEFSSLAELRHEGAADMADETLLLWAGSLADDGDLMHAYDILKKLGGRGGSAQYTESVMRRLYEQAQDYYRSGDLDAAADRFARLSPWRDSDRYLMLLQCRYYESVLHDGVSWSMLPGTVHLGECRFSSADEAIDALLELVMFEDARVILTDRFTREYLTGRWVTRALTYDLRMTDSGELTFSLPHYRVGSDYVIVDGEVRAYTDSPDEYTPMLELYPVSRTEMDVFCSKDGETYSMRKQ